MKGGKPRRLVGEATFRPNRAYHRTPWRGPRYELSVDASTRPDCLRATMVDYLESLETRHYSASTVQSRSRDFRLFCLWCEERAVLTPAEVTKPMLQRYQRHLFLFRKPDGHPLSVQRQAVMLVHLRGYFRWLCQRDFLAANPASDLLLPRKVRHLPRHALTKVELSAVLRVPDVSTLIGLRDRAILEVLWATGLRRAEVSKLLIWDVSEEKGTVFVREGKGKKDRVVPIGPRALEWVRRYVADVRPRFALAADEGVLFLSEAGENLTPDFLTGRVRQHLTAAGVTAKGSCHLFRHACATALLEGGADIRLVQEMLGHERLDTTQRYTRVTITQLRAVYAAAHPAAKVEAEAFDGAGAEAEADAPVAEDGAAAAELTAEELLDDVAAEDEDAELHEEDGGVP